MCLIAFALDWHPRYRLILAGNRDEAYARPTAHADWWTDAPAVCGGRDQSAGGGWLAINRDGRLAAVTNFRQPMVPHSYDSGSGADAGPAIERPTRGALVERFVSPTLSGVDRAAHLRRFTDDLAGQAGAYAGFNLLLFDLGHGASQTARGLLSPAAMALSNRAAGTRPLPSGAADYRFQAQAIRPGVHSLSNALFNVQWPKTRRLAQALRATAELNDPSAITKHLLEVLADRTLAPDLQLPDTGIGLERERQLAPVFIEAPVYGTRASTVILVDRHGQVELIERSFGPGGVRLPSPSGDIQETRPPGDIQETRPSDDIQVTRLSGNIRVTTPSGDEPATSLSGDVRHRFALVGA